jgi:hypothetical protein
VPLTETSCWANAFSPAREKQKDNNNNMFLWVELDKNNDFKSDITIKNGINNPESFF